MPTACTAFSLVMNLPLAWPACSAFCVASEYIAFVIWYSGFFSVISIVTTTGYVSVDYQVWGPLAALTFFFLSFVGGCTGSTTGGLGGVHRGAQDTWDESADLAALSSVPVTVVCAGVKSILDVPATLERLESLSVTVLGFRTDTFPGFYIRDTGLPVPWRVDGPAEVAASSSAAIP